MLLRVERLHRAIEPTIFGRLHTRSARLHEVLSIKMRTRFIRRTCGMDDCQVPLVPQRLERVHRGMQSEEAVEIDRRKLRAGGTRNGNRRTHSVVRLLTVRHYEVQTIGSAALEQHDQAFLARACS